MLVFVVYDITSTKPGNRRRNRIVKKLLEAGLYRIQKSVFLGSLNKNEIDDLDVHFKNEIHKALIKDEKDAAEDKIYLFPVSKDDFDAVKMIGMEFNKALVSDEIKALIL